MVASARDCEEDYESGGNLRPLPHAFDIYVHSYFRLTAPGSNDPNVHFGLLGGGR